MSTIYFEKVDNNIYMTCGIEKRRRSGVFLIQLLNHGNYIVHDSAWIRGIKTANACNKRFLSIM